MNNNEKLAKIAVNKSLVKEFSNSSENRIVYLNNGTEFQIQIFNPYSYTIGVSFAFNDTNVWNHSNLLVLRPGERVWLDRYLTENKKLLFSAYEVGNSKEVKEAIQNNGKLEVKFFKEYEKKRYWDNSQITINANDNINPYKPIDVYYDNFDSNILGPGYNIQTYCNQNLSANAVTLGFSSLSSVTSASCGTLQSTATASSTKLSDKSNARSKSIETGRIEKGGYSNQNFKQVNMDFESWPFKTEVIHIYPASQKPVTSSDLNKKYCYNCGRKLVEKFKYCPFCGAKQ